MHTIPDKHFIFKGNPTFPNRFPRNRIRVLRDELIGKGMIR